LNKIIALFSFGHYYSDSYPRVPEKNTCQIVLDLRLLYEPFHDGHQESGLAKNITELVIKENKKFFSSLKPLLEELIGRFRQNDRYHTLNIFFGCYGGWQRSVAAVEYFKNWLKTKHPEMSIATEHLTITRHH